MRSEAAQDQGWTDSDEALRLAKHKPRWCSECNRFTDHHTSEHGGEQQQRIESDRKRWCGRCAAWTDHTRDAHEEPSES